MKAAEKAVVSIHYTLKNDGGEVVDTSSGKDPLKFLFGSGMIIPGLEKELSGKEAGESFKVTVQPEEAYGDIQEELVQDVPKQQLEHIEELQVGTVLQADTGDGTPLNLVVIEINDEFVKLNGNHPLAGEVLHFEGEVTEVREATEEELAHGHAH
jgi:FKBP-type peptidyl-prolyl cis-trans isomerase SlyD